jgi:hypothetical protein
MTSAARAALPLDAPAACRNCGAPAPGTYCPACGQETQLRLPTARVFLREAMGRYVALDGRLWRTLAALMLRPGLLTREYFSGRRRRFIRPARLFLVLSLVLFAVIRIFANPTFVLPPEQFDVAQDKPGSGPAAKPTVDGEGGVIQMPGFAIRVDPKGNIGVEGGDVRWTAELRKRFERFNHLAGQDKSDQVFAGMVRYGPYAMFVLMPAFALLLQIAYAGRGARYPGRPRRYAEHLVFAAHIHAFVFLVTALMLALPWPALRTALGIWMLLYCLWATKKVYGGRWIGLVLRAGLIGVAYLTVMAFTIVGLLISAVVLR